MGCPRPLQPFPRDRRDPGRADESYDIDNDPDGYTRADLTPRDWQLETLVRILSGEHDDTDTEVGVTLTFGGLIVSGIAISGAHHARLTGERLRDAGQDEFAESWRMLTEAPLAMRKQATEERSVAGLPRVARRFIHLKDVSIIAGPQVTSLPTWRGFLPEITGWSFGNF